MQAISRHISYLLLNCRKVVVPGLGTFSACYERATFDTTDKLFYPSRIRINFTSNYTHSDFILENSIKRKLKISRLEAERLLKDFVSLINLKIEKNQYIRLDGIGYLLKNDTGDIYLKDTFWERNKYPGFLAMRV